jgi:hypothetical protein
MAAKLTRLTHKIAVQLHLVSESCTICSFRSRGPVRKLLDTSTSYLILLVWLNQGGRGGRDMWHAWGRGEVFIGFLVARPEGKRPLRRPRRRLKDNIKMDFRETEIDGANWIRLAQDRVRWRTPVNTAINLQFPWWKRLFLEKMCN